MKLQMMCSDVLSLDVLLLFVGLLCPLIPGYCVSVTVDAAAAAAVAWHLYMDLFVCIRAQRLGLLTIVVFKFKHLSANSNNLSTDNNNLSRFSGISLRPICTLRTSSTIDFWLFSGLPLWLACGYSQMTTSMASLRLFSNVFWLFSGQPLWLVCGYSQMYRYDQLVAALKFLPMANL
uniref:Uncharacterized protein n=1 Tax=Glossina brevipalpis TaxID=37001 RepID=A0A1A9WJ10_9MUSC